MTSPSEQVTEALKEGTEMTKVVARRLEMPPNDDEGHEDNDDQFRGPFKGTFDYIFLVCPTFIHNKTDDGFAENDDRVFVVVPPQTGCEEQGAVDTLLRWLSILFEGTNTLLVLDDCAASKDVKGRSNQLVSLAFSARHIGISLPVLQTHTENTSQR